MTAVYYVMNGHNEILVSTMAGRAKAKVVRQDERVSLCVLDENWPLTYLQIYGHARLDEDFETATTVLRQVLEVMAGQPMPDTTRPDVGTNGSRRETSRRPHYAVRHIRNATSACAPRRGPRHPDPLDEQEPAMVTPDRPQRGLPSVDAVTSAPGFVFRNATVVSVRSRDRHSREHRRARRRRLDRGRRDIVECARRHGRDRLPRRHRDARHDRYPPAHVAIAHARLRRRLDAHELLLLLLPGVGPRVPARRGLRGQPARRDSTPSMRA